MENSNDYYTNKQKKNLVSFKYEIELICALIWANLGYYSYTTKHLLLFSFITFLILFCWFVFKFLKGVGELNTAYNEVMSQNSEKK